MSHQLFSISASRSHQLSSSGLWGGSLTQGGFEYHK